MPMQTNSTLYLISATSGQTSFLQFSFVSYSIQQPLRIGVVDQDSDGHIPASARIDRAALDRVLFRHQDFPAVAKIDIRLTDVGMIGKRMRNHVDAM